MKKYAVCAAIEMKVWVFVEAESKEDAIEKATQLNESDFLNGAIEDVSDIDVQFAHEEDESRERKMYLL